MRGKSTIKSATQGDRSIWWLAGERGREIVLVRSRPLAGYQTVEAFKTRVRSRVRYFEIGSSCKLFQAANGGHDKESKARSRETGASKHGRDGQFWALTCSFSHDPDSLRRLGPPVSTPKGETQICNDSRQGRCRESCAPSSRKVPTSSCYSTCRSQEHLVRVVSRDDATPPRMPTLKRRCEL